MIYNITFSIDESIHEKWRKWMHEKHIPDMIHTGKFLSAKMAKVLIEEEMGGITYSVQFLTDSKGTLQKYYKEDEPQLRQEGLMLFADKMLTFTTELEVINEY